MFPIEIRQWAIRHHVGADALAELAAVLGSVATEATGTGSESNVASRVRLAAPSYDMKLWRNNVVVLRNEAGTPVRCGLANESPAQNKRIKSGDWIGWRRRLIAPTDVGSVIAQFTSIETKREGWTPAPPTNVRDFEHEEAQRRWTLLVNSEGGYAKFVSDPAQLA